MAYAFTAALYLALCLWVQHSSGAADAAFVAYSDEPSHFVGTVMVRDWLVSGHLFAPLSFARDYYDHYPYFAIGYWPPLFHIVTGLWFLAAGAGRLQALLVPAAFAAGTGWLIFQLVRPRAGFVGGLCAGAVYLSLPTAQQLMCAVMVDHMTAFLCIAAGFCLLRYLDDPALGKGVLCALCIGCAILSKYNAAYTLALPFLAALCLRRNDLWRKPSFIVQPIIVALMVGPWAVWTSRLAFSGLPSAQGELSARRMWSFVQETFRIFPPVMMVVVILGLIALVALRRTWNQDLVVLGVLGIGHLAFLILSPVPPEQRYLLVPVAILLVFSFAGWWAALDPFTARKGRLSYAVPALAAILTIGFAISQFGGYPQPLQYPIRPAVRFVVENPAWRGRPVVASPNLEGPIIAEFVARDSHRPGYQLLRPGKILAHADWLGRDYSSTFATSEEMMEYFRRQPVSVMVWNEPAEATRRPHERIMTEMLERYPQWWHKAASFASAGGEFLSCSVYEFVRPAGAGLR